MNGRLWQMSTILVPGAMQTGANNFMPAIAVNSRGVARLPKEQWRHG